MSRGLGALQRRLLVSIAVIAEGHERGADVFDVLTLWGHLDDKPRQAFDRANLHRGLQALAQRGLLAATDHADYTPRCRCRHAPAEHRRGRDWCQTCFAPTRRIRCLWYRPRPTPRPHWYWRLTPAGMLPLRVEDTDALRAAWHALQRQRREALARAEASIARARYGDN
jgi:hypothetical protein